MVISLVNNVEFYSHLRSSGYINGVGRIGQIRPMADSSTTSDDINQINVKKAAKEKIGSGIDSNYKSTGVYVDVLHPEYSRQSPVSKSENSFKSVLQSMINRPETNAREYSKLGAKKPDKSINDNKFDLSTPIQSRGFVITVPGEHLAKINSSNDNSLRNKLHDIYSNNTLNYSGSLVNVTV